ncbi:hypothetical protein [Streptomyces sp. MZ04]|uniref:hypothetical protein n=1 Tax=Streptomyces sp. MZ04 TaxID=2559236 RepID=UPI001432BF9B|nr:hypothetical protein [Streptomyces sp. MZ04]
MEGITVGMSTTGCLAAAKKELFGSLDAWFRPHVIERNLGALAHRRVVRDSRFSRASKSAGATRELTAEHTSAVREKYRRELDALKAIDARAVHRAREIARST